MLTLDEDLDLSLIWNEILTILPRGIFTRGRKLVPSSRRKKVAGSSFLRPSPPFDSRFVCKTKMYELNVCYTCTIHRIGLMELSTEKIGGSREVAKRGPANTRNP